MITDVDVKPATSPDNAFVQAAIQRTQQVVGDVVEVSMDGAYNEINPTPSMPKNTTSNSITVACKEPQGVSSMNAQKKASPSPINKPERST